MSYTPGPWKAHFDKGNASVTTTDSKGTEWPICLVYLGSDTQEGRDITNLIASVPEMMAELARLRSINKEGDGHKP